MAPTDVDAAIDEAKSLICDMCRNFYTQGWCSGSGGGISVKVIFLLVMDLSMSSCGAMLCIIKRLYRRRSNISRGKSDMSNRLRKKSQQWQHNEKWEENLLERREMS